ncbi:MAG: hypothetical protein AAGD17_07055 [Bacteroidota bacterium]
MKSVHGKAMWSPVAFAYIVDENGFEQIAFFAIHDWWAVDFTSFIRENSARFFIAALEDTELLQISRSDFFMLLYKVPKLEKWFRILLQNALMSTENRVTYKMSNSAEERYLKFL